MPSIPPTKAAHNINKRQQDFFERLKEDQKHNLELKAALCEKAEEIANIEDSENKDWNALSKQIENLQGEWKSIGFASKKENQKIYDRFRAACDKFYNAKREFYSNFKVLMQDNMQNIRQRIGNFMGRFNGTMGNRTFNGTWNMTWNMSKPPRGPGMGEGRDRHFPNGSENQSNGTEG